MKDKSQWYLLYCKAKQESRAQVNLERQGINSFYPTLQVDKTIRKQRKLVEVALFPNYLFVEMSGEDNFTSVRSTRGVLDFVKINKCCASVSRALVEQLLSDQDKRIAAYADEVVRNHGDSVLINDGPFAGIEAIYECKDGLERSMLLLNFLNQTKKVSISNSHYQ